MPSEPRPGSGEIFLTWFVIGIQSFGGGSSTFYLIHKVCTERGWLTDQDFVRTWALAQVSPGINLLKLTTLVGYRLRGWRGVSAGLAGLLLPSGAVTALMTAGFSVVRHWPLVQSAMRGILPATIGLSLAASTRMAFPLMTQARREGRLRLGAHLLLSAGAAVLMASQRISPVIVLLLIGLSTPLVLAIVPVGSGAADGPVK